MLRYLVRRLLLLVPILFGVSLLIFFWIRALPGSPAESLLGERATPALVKAYRQRYGLDKPVYQQYWAYLKTTIIGLQTGLLLSGAVLTETVFAYPGMGSWLRDAIFNRDYPVLQGGILFLALVFVLVNLIVDLSYAIINPRIRYS